MNEKKLIEEFHKRLLNKFSSSREEGWIRQSIDDVYEGMIEDIDEFKEK